MHVAIERNWQKRRVPSLIDYISLQPIGSSLADVEVTLVASDLERRVNSRTLEPISADSMVWPYTILDRCEKLIGQGCQRSSESSLEETTCQDLGIRAGSKSAFCTLERGFWQDLLLVPASICLRRDRMHQEDRLVSNMRLEYS